MQLAQAYLAVAAKLPSGDDVKKRLDRAYDIVRGTGYSITQLAVDTTVYEIYKASTSLLEDSSARYIVDTVKHSCTCPDYATARGSFCKHRLAVMMTLAMEVE